MSLTVIYTRACRNTDCANRWDAGTSPHPPLQSAPRSPCCSPRLFDWSRQSKGAIKQKLTQNTQNTQMCFVSGENSQCDYGGVWWIERSVGRDLEVCFRGKTGTYLDFSFGWMNSFLPDKHVWFHILLVFLHYWEGKCIIIMNEVQYLKLAKCFECLLQFKFSNCQSFGLLDWPDLNLLLLLTIL